MKRTPHPTEDLRLEAVIVSTNFDDVLAVTIPENLPHFDTLIVVTTPEDIKTQTLCKKLCVTCVQTDLIHKDGGQFNRGAAVNAGFDHLRFFGWRLHMDSDIILPKNFRRLLFNFCQLDPECLYGADRVDVSPSEVSTLRTATSPSEPYVEGIEWQHRDCFFVESPFNRKIWSRNIDSLRGWLPIGYFQLWHASQQKAYPHSLGNCAHDDESFSAMWPRGKRRLMPEVIVYHMATMEGGGHVGGGHTQAFERTTPRLDEVPQEKFRELGPGEVFFQKPRKPGICGVLVGNPDTGLELCGKPLGGTQISGALLTWICEDHRRTVKTTVSLPPTTWIFVDGREGSPLIYPNGKPCCLCLIYPIGAVTPKCECLCHVASKGTPNR